MLTCLHACNQTQRADPQTAFVWLKIRCPPFDVSKVNDEDLERDSLEASPRALPLEARVM